MPLEDILQGHRRVMNVQNLTLHHLIPYVSNIITAQPCMPLQHCLPCRVMNNTTHLYLVFPAKAGIHITKYQHNIIEDSST